MELGSQLECNSEVSSEWNSEVNSEWKFEPLGITNSRQVHLYRPLRQHHLLLNHCTGKAAFEVWMRDFGLLSTIKLEKICIFSSSLVTLQLYLPSLAVFSRGVSSPLHMYPFISQL